MANIKSSQKKNRQRITHEARNRAQKSAMRTAVKALRAATKGVIKRRTAGRSVSRLTVAVNALK